jgi:hypothetical protein
LVEKTMGTPLQAPTVREIRIPPLETGWPIYIVDKEFSAVMATLTETFLPGP